jgi:hypothetical protein
MKTIIMRTQKSSRWAAMLLATVVAIITSMVVANATQTITTPNAVKITYNLAAFTNGAGITPATNTSVLVMGCCTTPGAQGAGGAILQHIPSGGMTWVAWGSDGNVTHGSSAGGAYITVISSDTLVAFQVASADMIRVRNNNASVRAGNVTLVW